MRSAVLPTALPRRNPWRRLFALLGLVAGFAFANAAAPAPTDYQVKAVFLFNFAQFVEWPTNAFANENSPVVIGILGEDPFGGVLDQTVKGERARGRLITTKRFAADEEPEGCQ